MPDVGDLLIGDSLVIVGLGEEMRDTFAMVVRITAGMTYALPIQSESLHLRGFMFSSGVAENTASYLTTVNESASTIEATSGVKNEVLAMSYNDGATHYNTPIGPRTQLYVTSGQGGVFIIVFERGSPAL